MRMLINKTADVKTPKKAITIANKRSAGTLVLVTDDSTAHISNHEITQTSQAPSALAVLILYSFKDPRVFPLPPIRGLHELLDGLEIARRNARLDSPLRHTFHMITGNGISGWEELVYLFPDSDSLTIFRACRISIRIVGVCREGVLVKLISKTDYIVRLNFLLHSGEEGYSTCVMIRGLKIRDTKYLTHCH